ncbi:hypothetical protein AKUH3B103M_PHAGE100090 (plasmid) [Apilactobacillus kunkeei]|nr:hypothetical protein AKUH3B103M_PHAGE100090 [Apilactobacillus kunkeei]
MMNNAHQKPTPEERIEILTRQVNMINLSNIRLKKQVKQLERERNTYLKMATKLQGKRMK